MYNTVIFSVFFKTQLYYYQNMQMQHLPTLELIIDSFFRRNKYDFFVLLRDFSFL